MLPQNKIPPDISEYVNATSLDMALDALADGKGTPLAGGSDLWAQKDTGNGRLRARLVNIGRVDEMRGISTAGDVLRIGALTTMTEVLESDLLAAKLPVLVSAANQFASSQIRNVATLAGNIVNASPAADAVLPLIALDAVVEIHAKDKPVRKEALDGFFNGPGKTKLAPEELIVAIELVTPPKGFYGVFHKSGSRPALEISMAAMCLTGMKNDGIFDDTRIVYGAVGPTPMRCKKTENLINGQEITDDLIAAVLEMMASEISPIDDFRASKWYRTQIAKTWLEEELLACR